MSGQLPVKLNKRDENALACRSRQFCLSLDKVVYLVAHLAL